MTQAMKLIAKRTIYAADRVISVIQRVTSLAQSVTLLEDDILRAMAELIGAGKTKLIVTVIKLFKLVNKISVNL